MIRRPSFRNRQCSRRLLVQDFGQNKVGNGCRKQSHEPRVVIDRSEDFLSFAS